MTGEILPVRVLLGGILHDGDMLCGRMTGGILNLQEADWRFFLRMIRITAACPTWSCDHLVVVRFRSSLRGLGNLAHLCLEARMPHQYCILCYYVYFFFISLDLLYYDYIVV